MKNKFFVVGMLVFVLGFGIVLIGCQPKASGKYVITSGDAYFKSIEFDSDKTCKLNDRTRVDYEIVGSRLTIKIDGNGIDMTIKGNTIVGDKTPLGWLDGTYEKQK